MITCRASRNSASVTARCFCRASLLACSCSCCCACFAASACLPSTSRLTWSSYHLTLHSKLLCRPQLRDSVLRSSRVLASHVALDLNCSATLLFKPPNLQKEWQLTICGTKRGSGRMQSGISCHKKYSATPYWCRLLAQDLAHTRKVHQTQTLVNFCSMPGYTLPF